MKALLDAGAAPDVEALAWAAGRGREDVVRLLVQKGADPNLTTYDGVTPLQVAAAMGRRSTVDLLLRLGARRTLLTMAMAGRASDAKELLEAGTIGLDRPDPLCKRTPLYWAAAEGHFDVAKLLLRAGADPNRCGGDATDWLARRSNDSPPSESMGTPLRRAALDRRARMVGLLLVFGAKWTLSDLETLATDPSPDAEEVLAQLAAKGLRADAWLALLRGLVRSDATDSTRMRRFDRFLTLGASPHLRSLHARGLLADIPAAVTAPFVPELRRRGWSPDLKTAVQHGWEREVRRILRATTLAELQDAAQTALTADRPAVLRILRSTLAEGTDRRDYRDPNWWANEAVLADAPAVLSDLLRTGEIGKRFVEDGWLGGQLFGTTRVAAVLLSAPGVDRSAVYEALLQSSGVSTEVCVWLTSHLVATAEKGSKDLENGSLLLRIVTLRGELDRT
ncbi:MAG: ankyrin repeat domain-containing protein, partial [Planctomycetes bacterium]|nr:ankyrin repeat domain-containing protein [Planctomycetota bacterium]